MGLVQSLVNTFWPKRQQRDAQEVEELRIDFKARYHNFKLLLSANNRSLEIMAEMEQALQGDRPFGMNFIKAHSTAVSVNVFRMIKNLNEIAHGKYQDLYKSFDAIQFQVENLLTRKKSVSDERLVIYLDEVDKDLADLVGNKMANLGELKNKVKVAVPGGFAITSYAYQRFLEHNNLQAEIDSRFQSAGVEDIEQLYSLSAEVQQLIIRSKLPQDLEESIMNSFLRLEAEAGRRITVALRSSALGEDSGESSFAGQYRSELNVSVENIIEAYKEIIASKYSLPAITYRLNKGFKDEDISMCVGCLVMVDAASGGVTYSRNPVDINDDSVFINSAWGLPKSVVDGSVNCDLTVVSRKKPMTIIRREIKDKDVKFVCYPQEGLCRVELTGDVGRASSVDPDQALALAELAILIEDHYGCPQDIEWAVTSDGEIKLLQCRPLQQMPGKETDSPGDVQDDDDTALARGGITASSGVACGQVFLADRAVDILQFPPGAVLVTHQALPRWASLLNRAAAVVTEQGGFAGHLANVAREFAVPALFGVAGAVEKLRHEELVTVDAGGRVIYRGRIEDLLLKADSNGKKNLMEGSPVFDTLKDVSRHIIPLTLIDPDAKEFVPANCTTFHDITRYVHEKSVQEMFNFGKEHNFSERSSKQLYYHAPMMWWILNLDDGFKEEVTGKYIKIENIGSKPMLALWDGIVAIPWDGPPPIDGKGLMSVMFQATQNTSLNTGVKSKYSERNYFMISKNYCCLNSRLGFHFCTIEALIGDRPSENYISFQFKGGAADYDRRLKRVIFVGEILQEYGFRTEIKEDTMISRLEGHDQEFMISRLKIIGYLSIHTRQLDMIMTHSGKVTYYRNKIKEDIKTILAQPAGRA
ncbi:MAG: pyruvate, water dikinase [Deltaproteobacteria bacterium]|nr:pyruvate, water dikinase [Deltaproteobacteria bacterium]MBF0523779.1 pyruvate, water dikinase [Deltaproteobacteria bacterium]